MKVALITGGTSGIGLAIARHLTLENITVIVCGRDANKAKQVLAPYSQVHFLPIDVTQEHSVATGIQHLISEHNRLDIVINNAGLSLDSESDLHTMSTQDITTIINTNLLGPLLITKYTIPHLVKSQGTIINISSQLGLKADPETPLYCATKSALIMLTQSLALRYAPDNVRINCICPGPTNTPLLQKYFKDEQHMRDYYAQANPLGRVADPSEIAELASFLISDKAKNITGGIYTIDGGSYLK